MLRGHHGHTTSWWRSYLGLLLWATVLTSIVGTPLLLRVTTVAVTAMCLGGAAFIALLPVVGYVVIRSVPSAQGYSPRRRDPAAVVEEAAAFTNVPIVEDRLPSAESVTFSPERYVVAFLPQHRCLERVRYEAVSSAGPASKDIPRAHLFRSSLNHGPTVLQQGLDGSDDPRSDKCVCCDGACLRKGKNCCCRDVKHPSGSSSAGRNRSVDGGLSPYTMIGRFIVRVISENLLCRDRVGLCKSKNRCCQDVKRQSGSSSPRKDRHADGCQPPCTVIGRFTVRVISENSLSRDGVGLCKSKSRFSQDVKRRSDSSAPGRDRRVDGGQSPCTVIGRFTVRVISENSLCRDGAGPCQSKNRCYQDATRLSGSPSPRRSKSVYGGPSPCTVMGRFTVHAISENAF